MRRRHRPQPVNGLSGRTRIALPMAFFVIVLCLPVCGCGSLVKNGFQTMIAEPWKFCNNKDIARTKSQNRRLARDAWKEIEKEFPGRAVSADHAKGFREGFANFLDYGGSGLPPVLPPRRHWRTKQRSSAHRLATEEWFDGFAHGTTVARQSGLRELVIVPASLCLTPATSQIAVDELLQHGGMSDVRSVRGILSSSAESSEEDPSGTNSVQSYRELEVLPVPTDAIPEPDRD